MINQQQQTAAFKIGDVVRLKSGGPKMTITGITNDGIISTKWFTEQDLTKPFFTTFTAPQLEFVNSDS